MQGTQVRQVLFKRPAPLSDRLCCEVPPEFSSCGGSNQTFMFYEVLTSLYHCNNHSIKVRQHTWGLLTWETETLHVLAVFTAKSGMEAPKVRVPTRDDGRNLIARARLDHMDRVQLERNGEQRVWAPRRTDLSHGTFKTSPVDQRLLRIRDSDQSIQIQSMDVHQHFTQRRYKGQGLSVALKLKLLCRHLRISAAWRRDKLIPVGVFVCPKTNKLKAFVKSRVPGFEAFMSVLVIVLQFFSLCQLTTYFEEPSCTTLASVTSNNTLSVCHLTEDTELPPLSPRKLLQLSWSCRVSREEEEEEEWPTGEIPTGLVSTKDRWKPGQVTREYNMSWFPRV